MLKYVIDGETLLAQLSSIVFSATASEMALKHRFMTNSLCVEES